MIITHTDPVSKNTLAAGDIPSGWRGREHYTLHNGELVKVVGLGNRNDFELYSKAG